MEDADSGRVRGGIVGSGVSWKSEYRGEEGESRGSKSRSEMLLARRPRPLGGRISGEGGDGDMLGERGHGTREMCSMAHLDTGRPLRLRKRNLEAKEDTRWRRDIDIEDWDVKEIVDGECECFRLGTSLFTRSKFGERGNLLCRKKGMTQRGKVTRLSGVSGCLTERGGVKGV